MNTFTTEEIAAIQKIFDQFDRDNDGCINRKELERLSIALNDPLTPAELMDFVNEIDTDCSGKITWDEFVAYWAKK